MYIVNWIVPDKSGHITHTATYTVKCRAQRRVDYLATMGYLVSMEAGQQSDLASMESK